MDVGNVRARIYNDGMLFWKGGQNLYETPKNGGISAIFTTSFMVGGIMDGELRMAASTYGPYEFWPGPLDGNGNPPADCSVYDHIWEIHSDDFQLYDTEGASSQNMLDWPWALGAPVVDGDGVPNNYNLEGGDRPELLGNQTLWWVMNDRGNEHRWTETEPIGVEVHGSAFAFDHLELGTISFYRYRIFNKNTIPLTDAFLGIFADTDLGNASDDYVGSDSLLNLGYTYNSDPIDENWYEDKPPAIGYTFLVTPEAALDEFDNDRDGEVDEPGEPAGMYSARYYSSGGGIQGDPGNGREMFNILKGLWQDGQSIVEGGSGLFFQDGWPSGFPVKPTRFTFSGDPVQQSFWTEFSPFPGIDAPNPAGDRWFAMSSGPFTLPPGESTDFLVAIIAAHGNDYLDSVRKLKAIAGSLQTSTTDYLISGYQPERRDQDIPAPEFVLGFDQNFPNPFSGTTTLRYSLPKTMGVRLAIYDMLGREITVLVENTQEAGIYSLEFDGTRLPAGVYYARIELGHLRFIKKMVRGL